MNNGRPSKGMKIQLQKKVRKCFERNYSASYASQKTGINIKTVCKYYNDWSNQISQACQLDFLKRQKQDREQIILSYDGLIEELYDHLEIIRQEISQYKRKGKEIPRWLLDRRIQTILSIATLNEKKGAFSLQMPAAESLEKTVEQLVKKWRN